MIRVHDVENGMRLVAGYDFPENSGRRRIVKAKSEFRCDNFCGRNVHPRVQLAPRVELPGVNFGF
jgi:hypothetical protein